MKQNQIILIVIGFILVALMATNPTAEEHKEAIKKEFFKAIESDNNSNSAQKIGEKIGQSIVEVMIDNMVYRENLILLSIIKTKERRNAAGDDEGNKTISVGIFGQIFLLKKYDNVSKEFVDNNGINETEVYATTDSTTVSIDTAKTVKFSAYEKEVASEDYSTDLNGDIVDVIGTPIKIGNLEVAQNNFPQLMNWEDAKKACKTLSNGWRLPTKDELNILYINMDEIGSFTSDACWSSDKAKIGFAWSQNFQNGSQNITNMKNLARVRAIRIF
jgi:hypothetical protein